MRARAKRGKHKNMHDSRYEAFCTALQHQPIVSLSEERIIDGQTAMGMLSHLQEQKPFYMIERFGDGSTVMALDPYLTMACDAHRTRIACGGQAHIAPAITAWDGLAMMKRRFALRRGASSPEASIFGMLNGDGMARWMVPQAEVILHPNHRDRVTVIRHVFSESVAGDTRAIYKHAMRQLRRLVTWLSAPTYVKPLSVHAPAMPMHDSEAGRATPMHVYRYLRQLVPAKTACFVHEDGLHLLGADLQSARTSPEALEKQLHQGALACPRRDTAYAVFHASADGMFCGTLPEGALRIEHVSPPGATTSGALPVGTAAEPYREALRLADGDVL